MTNDIRSSEAIELALMIKEEVARKGIKLAVFGGAASACMRCRCDSPCSELSREVGDLDVFSLSHDELTIERTMKGLGFVRANAVPLTNGFHLEFLPRRNGKRPKANLPVHIYSGLDSAFAHSLDISDCFPETAECICLRPVGLLLTKLGIPDFKKNDALDVLFIVSRCTQCDGVPEFKKIAEEVAKRCTKSWCSWSLFGDVKKNIAQCVEVLDARTGDLLTSNCEAAARSALVILASAIERAQPTDWMWRLRDHIGPRLACMGTVE
jgi:hypothetical protein